MKKILFVLFLVLLLVVVSSCQKATPVNYEDEYYALEKKYNQLSSQYENLSDAIWKVETDVYCLYSYFDGDSTISQKEARDSAFYLYKILYPVYHK